MKSRGLLTDRADGWALLALVLMVLVFTAPLLANPGRMRDPENGDTMNYYLHLELARRSIVEYGQWPWWSPYVGGGLPLIGHPRDVSLSPVVLPALILPPIEAVKVICILIYLAGALGMYYLTRGVLGLGRIASVAASVLLVTSAWLPARLVGGNYDEWHLVLFPLLVALFLKSRQHWRYIIYAAAVLYVTIIDGKYIVAIFGLYLALIAVALVIRSAYRRRFSARPLLSLVVLMVLAAMLSAVKWVPLRQLMASARVESQRLTGAAVGTERPGVSRPITAWDAGRLGVRAIDDGDDNFGSQAEDLGTGYAALAVFILGCALAGRRMWGWLLLLPLSLILMFSRIAPPWMDLFDLLHRLPVFNALRKPYKYFNFLVLFVICLGVAHGLNALGGGRRRRGWMTAAVAVVTLVLPYFWHLQLQWRIFSAPVDGPKVENDGDFHTVVAFDRREIGQRQRMFKDYFFIREGVGVLNWYDPLTLPSRVEPRRIYTLGAEPRLNPGYRGEAYLLSGGHAVVRREAWRPNRIVVDLERRGEDALVINQNYDPRWRSSAGEAVDHLGRLAVRLPPDGPTELTVALTYRPTDHCRAAAVSLVTALVCAAALVIGALRRRRGTGRV